MTDPVARNPLAQVQAYAQLFRSSWERGANMAPSEMRGLGEAIASRLESMSQPERQQFLRDIQTNTDIPQMLSVLRRQGRRPPGATGANAATDAGAQLDRYLAWAHAQAGIEPPSQAGRETHVPLPGTVNDQLVLDSRQAVREINASYQPGGRWSIETALQLPTLRRPKP